MFRLYKLKSDKSRLRIDFSLSSLQASQVKVQCISPKTSERNENTIGGVLNTEDLNTDCDMENKSDISDPCFTKSVGSSSSNCFDSSSHLEDDDSRDTTVPMVGSRNSFESLDDSLGRANSSSCSNFIGHNDDTLGRQNSTGSQSPSLSARHSISNLSKSNHSSLTSRVPRSRGQSLGQADDFGQLSSLGSSLLLNTGSSKDPLEVVDGSSEDLSVQANKWEQNARRLTLELERLQKKFDEQSKNQELLDLDLTSSKAQCEGLKQENEQLKNILEETMQKSMETSNSNSKNFQRQIEDELRFYKESNAKLAVQLEKTQESNVVSILQELEETIEKQKEEIRSKQDEITAYKNMCQKSGGVEQYSVKNGETLDDVGNQMLATDTHAKIRHMKNQSEQVHEKETALTSESMDSLDYKSLCGSVDSQDSVSGVLYRMSSEQESGKHDLELQISELEKENEQLSERVSGLEAQLRYLTDEKESSRLELQQSGSRVMFLQEEIRKLQIEMETERNDMNQKLLDMQQRWSKAQEECEHLKIVNPKLQSTTESVIEECSLLQRTNRDLMRQNAELHEQCAHLKAGLRESENTYSLCIDKVETLEEDFSSLIEEISMKSKSFNSEVDALFLENAKLKGQLLTEESHFFQEHIEKQAEVEKLQRKVQYLSEQLIKAHNGEKTTSEAAMEIAKLHANYAALEAALVEGQKKLNWFKDKYDTLKIAFEAREAEFSNRLADSNKKYEVLMADHGRIQGLLEEAKSSEQKKRNIVYALDLKLQASEYESLQLVEDITRLKDQLMKLPELQNEILALKNSLNEAKFANERLEASFQLLYDDHEALKGERTSLFQKILSMQMLESELEDCRNSKIALQEKLLRLEGDLTAREAECAEDVKLKHELGRMRRTNSQLQRTIRDFVDDKDEFLKTILDVEGNHKQKTLRHVASDVGGRYSRRRLHYNSSNNSISEEYDFSEMNGGDHFTAKRFFVVEKDSESPESKLTEVMSHQPEIQSSAAVASNESKEAYKQRASELEAELKDLHDRYFTMSLKYADIETERQELSIKLNTVEQGRGRAWFSHKP